MSSSLFRGGSTAIRNLGLIENDQLPARVGGSIFNKKLSDRSSVKIHLFTPVVREDPIIRPMQYQIGPDVMDAIQGTVMSARHDGAASITGTVRDRFHLRGDRSIDMALMPGHSHRFGRRYINEYWYVVLTVDNAQVQSRSMRSSKLKNQVIYTGYALGEPISRRGRLNEDCEIVFTHMTQMEVDEFASRDGYNAIVRPKLDIDIINPTLLDLDSTGDDDRKYLLGPDHVVDSMVSDYDADRPFDVTDQEIATLDHRDRGITEISVYNSPRQQLNRVITSLAKTVVEQDLNSSRSRLSSDNRPSIFSDKFGIKNTFKNFLGGNFSDRLVGPDYRQKQVSIGKLISLYPNLEDNAQVIELPPDLSIDSIDEEGSDLLAIMSNYLKCACPPVFADHGISDITLRYATSDPRDNFRTKRDRESLWDIIDVKTYLEEPFEHTRDRVQLCKDHLQDFVFSVVENICDDIEVLVRHSAGNDTLIQLQLRDHTEEINDGFAIAQNSLGGIISPQLGDSDTFQNHNDTLLSMIDIVDAGISQDSAYY